MSPLFFYQLALLGLLWLCVMLHLAWPSRGPVSSRRSVEPETSVRSRRTRSNAPTPFVGLPHKPPCVLCAHEASHPPPPPPLRPEPMSPTTRRPRQVDTSRHFCPHATCDYRGWLGLGNLRANGHPNGGPWRQFHCTACDGYFPEHHGTIFHGKRVSVDLIVRVIACLAEDFLPFVNPNLSHFFTPSARPAHDASGWHHNTYDAAAWPSGYAGVGRQYCVRPGHAAVPSPATPHTRC